MTTDPHALLAVRNAIENASPGECSDADIVAILRGERTSGAQVRAAFEDNSLRALARAGAAVGVELHTILAAYAAAKVAVVAANPELDEALRGGW